MSRYVLNVGLGEGLMTQFTCDDFEIISGSGLCLYDGSKRIFMPFHSFRILEWNEINLDDNHTEPPKTLTNI